MAIEHGDHVNRTEFESVFSDKGAIKRHVNHEGFFFHMSALKYYVNNATELCKFNNLKSDKSTFVSYTIKINSQNNII